MISNNSMLGHLLALVISFCLISFQYLENLESQNSILLSLIALAVVAHLIAVIFVKDLSLKVVFIWAVLLRGICFLPGFEPADLSSDVYRYLWEGKVLLSGESPYDHSPDSSELASLAAKNSELFRKVEHKEYSAIYQPAAMLFFAASGGELICWRVITQVLELLTLLLVFLWLRKEKLPSSYFITYAWLPLIFFEVSFAAHIDAVQSFFILFGVYLYQLKAKQNLAVLFISLGFMFKFLAAVPLSFVLLKSFKEKDFKPLLILLVTLSIFYLPFFFFSEGRVLDSVFVYARDWQFNGAVFSLLGSLGFEKATTKIICFLLLLSFWLYGLIKSTFSLSEFTAWTFFLLFILSSTVYPWYLLSFAALMPVLGNKKSLPMLIFCSTVLFSYEVLSHPEVWSLSSKLMLFEYLPVLVSFIFLSNGLKFSRS